MIRFLAPLVVIIQLTFAFHALKTGREQKWLWFIMFFPVVGCLAYYFFEVFPDSREERQLRAGIRDIAKALNPDAELKRRSEELATSESVANKSALADECLARGMFDESIRLYLSAMTAQFADDPPLLFGLARAYFYNRQFSDAKNALEKLQRAQKKFHREEVALLLARVFEALGNIGEAERIYVDLKDKYVGYEAKYRYGLLLKNSGRPAQANELFDTIVAAGNRHKRDWGDQEDWLKLAEKERQNNK